uniref:Uncharacterized protein n=1 Tax=Vespula pensylvanica TaxID=30213 RepID=A0A834PFX9_VESPE|nr:hypothetical protein H0235_001333 [Vespula pensylvanica]
MSRVYPCFDERSRFVTTALVFQGGSLWRSQRVLAVGKCSHYHQESTTGSSANGDSPGNEMQFIQPSLDSRHVPRRLFFETTEMHCPRDEHQRESFLSVFWQTDTKNEGETAAKREILVSRRLR